LPPNKIAWRGYITGNGDQVNVDIVVLTRGEVVISRRQSIMDCIVGRPMGKILITYF
jgi:hypothetical protein